ncbi:MAG: hypothetical protein KBC64_03000 [Simkaniaceae bacterium]|nr:hypothetical protein [Simkaniaceae bacterium]
MKWIGPPLEEGKLPTMIYFSLSEEESLEQDPFNQPAIAQLNFKMRVISFTLPGHENGQRDLSTWTSSLLSEFAKNVALELSSFPFSTLGVAGLSRGAAVACHLAKEVPEIQAILGFAPMTSHLTPEVIQAISNRRIRFYIGNRDTLVGTDQCCNLIAQLAESAYLSGIRSSPIELIIGPSIGRAGHGTSPEIFSEGAAWMRSQLHV